MVDILTGQILLSFRDPKVLNPYTVRAIDGLDAGAIRPRYYTSVSGQKFYSLEQEPRDIIVKAGLNPDFAAHQTYSQLRDNVYKVLTMSKSGRVDIHFVNKDQLVAILTGFVTKIENNPSDNDQIMTITINCEDPVLRSPHPVVVDTSSLGFDDVVINESVSTAPHGISFRVRFTSAVPNLVITDPTDDSWEFRVLPIGGFHLGDVLTISSEFGMKLIRARATNMMSRVTGKSIWPIIFPGENHLSFNHSGALEWQRLSYYRAYWGV